MDRIRELLGRITELSDDELTELKDLVLGEIGSDEAPPDEIEFAVLEELADASDKIKGEQDRRADVAAKRAEYAARINGFRDANADKPADGDADKAELATDDKAADATADADDATTAPVAASGNGVPADRRPRPEKSRTTVIRAGADLPGIALGSELRSAADVADAMTRRITSMRGLRGNDGDRFIVATAALQNVPDAYSLDANDAEGNTRKLVELLSNQQAITASGGLIAPPEVRYDLFDLVGDTDRPVKQGLPGFTSSRGSVRFMRAPTLADVNGVVGIWTVADDVEALTDPDVRKPSFRVTPGPEVVATNQALTLILTFGNLVARAFPEMVKRHNELALVAFARVAEQQLLTQMGALSTAVTTGTQRVSAAREVLASVSRAIAAYRNRHRMKSAALKAFFPVWFKDLLRSDVALQHPGDGLEIFSIADAKVESWFRDRGVNVVWTLDGEAGQDYSSLTSGTSPNYNLANYPDDVIWYLFAEGTFAHMDGGTLDLGLVRDSTLNAANDYQTFVETFESVVRFGNEALRVKSSLRPTGQGTIDIPLS